MADGTDRIIDGIIEREGLFVDRAEDHGGPTRYGVTMDTLQEWRKHMVTPRDVEKLQVTEARQILRELYINKPRFNEIPNATLQELVVDMGVHMGTMTVARMLQAIVGAKADGKLGPESFAMLARADVGDVYRRLNAARIRKLGGIITHDPSQAIFAGGWMNRAASFVERIP